MTVQKFRSIEEMNKAVPLTRDEENFETSRADKELIVLDEIFRSADR